VVRVGVGVRVAVAGGTGVSVSVDSSTTWPGVAVGVTGVGHRSSSLCNAYEYAITTRRRLPDGGTDRLKSLDVGRAPKVRNHEPIRLRHHTTR
jgi:hypothetical protein